MAVVGIEWHLSVMGILEGSSVLIVTQPVVALEGSKVPAGMWAGFVPKL